MDEEKPGTTIGTGISEALLAASRELYEHDIDAFDLDKIFWSSINTIAGGGSTDSLDSTFYNSLIPDEESWAPVQQDLSAYDPPAGNLPVTPAAPAASAAPVAQNPADIEKASLVNQVAELAIREIENRINQGQVATNQSGERLLFTYGDDKVFIGQPQQYGITIDDPTKRMEELLGLFYRGNRQDLEQVAQQIIDNAVRGTPIDVKKWLKR